jgi:cytochrome c biogenesis protein CcmG/thiol:disulfide interchange protein DsbE
MQLSWYGERASMSCSSIPIHYYKSVKRFVLTITLISVVLLVGCNSGSHPPRIGSPAPDFTVTDSHQAVTLSQLRGKPVLLNFWATWCPPCIEEMPSLLALHKELGDQVIILAVSEDADDAALRQFIRDHGVDLLTVRDTQHTNEVYGTFKYPETYIIDRNGKIVRKFIGPTNWTSPDVVDYLRKL